MYDNILVPLDGSKLAEVALPYAEELAIKFKARVTLLRVIEYTPEGVVPKEGVLALETIEQHYIEKLGRELNEKGINARAEVRVGNPAKEIRQFASQDNTDLIIMAARGRSNSRQWTPGNTADTTVRSANQSVLLIRVMENLHKFPKLHLLEKVLVPLDGSKEAATAIPYVEELASKLDMEMIFFMIVEKGYNVVPSDGDGAHRIYPLPMDLLESRKAKALEYLEGIAAVLRSKGIKVRCEATIGEAAKEITNLGDSTSVDLVAMSVQGRFGSIANKFLREGNNHLLLIRTQGE